MFRAVGFGFVLVAGGLALGAALVYSRDAGGPAEGAAPGEEGAAPLVVSPAQDLGDVVLRSDPMVRFELHNRSDHPIRIVGAADGCRAGLCVFMKTPLPCEIPPGHSTVLEFDCKFRKLGPVREQVAVYTSEPSQSTIKLSVTGRVVE